MKNLLIAAVLLGMSLNVFAEHDNANPNGVGHQGEQGQGILSPSSDQAQGQLQGQLQGQAQGQAQGQGQGQGQAQGNIGVNDNRSGSASGSAVSITTGGTTLLNETENDYQASSAPSAYAGVCQQGAGAQNEAGGFSIISSSQFCDYLKLAETMRLAADEAQAKGDTEKYIEYRTAYYVALSDAQNIINYSEVTGYIDRVGSQLVIPAALLAVLIVIL
jgi:hypothetical protein